MHDDVLAAARELLALGLTTGTAGNVSARTPDGIVITRSGAATDTATLSLDGDLLDGADPSSERALHLAVYRAYPEVGAVVHAHPVYATAFACARRAIPAAVDEFVLYVGGEVRCAEYAFSGTEALAANAVAALAGRRAVLLASHGLVTTGTTPRDALHVATVVERAAHSLWAAQALGGAVPLDGT